MRMKRALLFTRGSGAPTRAALTHPPRIPRSVRRSRRGASCARACVRGRWEPKQLQGDEIISLLVNGPVALQPAPDPSLEARWAEFMDKAFVMLGPRRFDEIKEITSLLQAGEIAPKDVVARSRYVMGREFEGLHAEYLTILRKLGYQLSKTDI